MNDTPSTLSADRHRLLREHLMDELARETAARPRRRYRWLLAPPLTAVLALALALLVPGTGDHGTPAPAVAPSTARSAGRSAVPWPDTAAQVARTQPAPAVKDSQYEWVRSAEVIDGQRRHRTVWVAADGKRDGLIEAPEQFGTAADPLGRIGLSCGRPTPDSPPDLLCPSYRYLAALPTDPQQLLQTVRAQRNGRGTDADSTAFLDIVNLLQGQQLTPAVRAALYQAAALVPGTELLDDAADLTGRHGFGLSRQGPDRETTVVVDRAGFDLLGVRTTLTMDGTAHVDEQAVLGRGLSDRPGT
ncbi:CU044_5270 family protein [Kitasatospora sp. McL0602]|uniref:CU044_5270 family protein n=1 Tax=Kitasatospora sp. McL0602 TaxID=3439530 RepID=UPI003F892DE4